MKIMQYLSICLLSLFARNNLLEARPVNLMNLADLATAADFIVAGSITTVRQVGAGTAEVGTGKVPCSMMVADIGVDQVLKGSVRGSALSVQFIKTESREFMGFMTPKVSIYSVFFLKQGDGNYSFASPVFFQMPAVPGVISGSGPILDQLVHQLAAVINSRDISSERKWEAVFWLGDTNGEAATEALRNASSSQDAAVRLRAIAKLLLRNDISTIDIAVDALLRPRKDLDYADEIQQNLLLAITNRVADPKATPSLIRLMQSGDVLVRRASISALIRTRSPEAIPTLAKALGDKDSEVRFNAVVALAVITQQPEWKPDQDRFRANEQRFLAHWKEWVKRH